ncbi:hypothetical protein MsAm2_12200 [Methanolapillus ohkumae]|uniref:Type II toxin-antitoxin system HicA family toxin n=1 Tax=Methanolapillus ohkumae TaxID=3028298 RepID=A0AA96ZW46_9EURY|nr:hypothetical protein MsAm2_12200 [Methanosarcinaceae archaeon Am2]
MSYKAREIESALKRKGFLEKRCGQHKYYYFSENSMIRTYTSHGNMEYDRDLLSQMKKQLRLNHHQFEDLIHCFLTKEKLIEIYSVFK